MKSRGTGPILVVVAAILRHDYDRAEEMYRRTIDKNPADTRTLRNYADFLRMVRNDHDRAEEIYWRAVDADSDRE